MNRNRWRTPIARAALLGGACFLAGLGVLAQAPSTGSGAGLGRPTTATTPAAHRASTVIVVRHAEKATPGDTKGDPKDDPKDESGQNPNDPGLSEVGRARAAALAHLLEHTGATHLFTSEYKRTRETLEPLATTLGVTPTIVSASKPLELIAALAALPEGSTSVVAGHSNTVPDLVLRLGGQVTKLVDGPGGKMLDDGAYGRLFVLTIPPASERANVAVTTVELAYGP